MAIQKCNATIVRRIAYSDSSLVMTLISPQQGRIEALAKGCRRPRSPLLGALELLTTGELVYYPRRNASLGIVAEFAPVSLRRRLYTEPARFAAGALLGEAAAALTVPEEGANRLGERLEKGLTHLEHCNRLIPGVVTGLLALLQSAGFAPLLTTCAVCGAPLEGPAAAIDPERCGGCCRACTPAAQPQIAQPVWKGLQYCLRGDWRASERLRLRAREASALLDICLQWVQAQTDRPLRSASSLCRHLPIDC